MRPISNPKNAYLSEHREWLGPPPAVEVRVYEESARSILSENDSPDIPFRWSINPYRGCQHACAYCYARPTHEYLGLGAGTDFDSRITVKTNAADVLARELSRSSWRREPIVFSGVTDCYQPLEAVYQVTRRCLEVCHDFRTPVGIVTKSYLVVRDVELLARMAAASGARVYVSIAFADDARARLIDRGAPPPSRRFEALKRLADAGVPVGVMVAPLIPGLNDRDVPAVLEQAAACGAQVATYTAVRLPGTVREVFLERLREALPDAAARVEARVRDMRGGRLNDSRFGCRMNGQGVYWESVARLFEVTATRLGLNAGQRWRKASPAVRPAVRQLPLFEG
ncbi:Radical SAM superfamily protein [Phycisphaerae bacterium RAS1]|nr:Radical SAM superfamily protein [Phycisphaerae bacterium RAS1]